MKREGLGAPLFPVFWLLAKAYCGGANLRNFLYDSAILNSTVFPLPVISVGNVTAGGSGKTPLTESIYHILEDAGFSPAIVTKGYRGKEKGPIFAFDEPNRFGDEASIYAIKGYRTIVSKEKIKGIEFAFSKGANVVILDDGFQYRKVVPKINIVTIDPFNPAGDGYCLPLGLLREPLSNLKRTDCFVITRSNFIDSNRLESLEIYLKSFGKPIFLARQTFKFWVNEKFEKTEPPENKDIDIFCGIGNPSQFAEMLIKLGYRIRNYFVFSDHHSYTEEEIEKLRKLKNPITTEKDLIKLRNSGIKVKVPILRLEAYGLKGFILSNIKNVERVEEEIEGNFLPSGVSTFKGESLFSRKS